MNRVIKKMLKRRKKKKKQSPEAKMHRALKSFKYLFFYKFKNAPKEKRLETLRFFALKKFKLIPKEELEFRRKRFLKKLSNSNTIVRYNGVIAKCKGCRENDSEIRHHIIQLQYGGHNGRTNQIALCIDCHDLIHPWLIKTCPA